MLVVATSLVIGLTLFPSEPAAVTSVSGVALTPQQLTMRIVAAMLYVARVDARASARSRCSCPP